MFSESILKSDPRQSQQQFNNAVFPMFNVLYYTVLDNIWKTDLDFLVIGRHQPNSFNTTLKLYMEPKTQSVLVPQSSPSANKSCKYIMLIILILKVIYIIIYEIKNVIYLHNYYNYHRAVIKKYKLRK